MQARQAFYCGAMSCFALIIGATIADQLHGSNIAEVVIRRLQAEFEVFKREIDGYAPEKEHI